MFKKPICCEQASQRGHADDTKMGDGADKVKDQAQKVMEGMKKMPRPPSGSGKLLVAGAGLLGTGYVLHVEPWPLQR